MDFTDDMIKEVLFALQQQATLEQQRAAAVLDIEDAAEDFAARPAGRHFRDDTAMLPAPPAAGGPSDASAAERRLAEMQALSQDDELHVLTRDYIVAVTNQVVHKLERAS